MKIPAIDQADLDDLVTALPGLSFTDEERRAVLLENGTRDVNAAPGSGKTTILAAKLLMLARKWPYDRRGVCVISHTNVARDEIQRRLASSVEGSRLLAYPHFIGTIHGFVNQFLALPMLRSSGLEVDVIDNDAFAKQALSMAMRKGTLRFWMEKNVGVADIVSTLVLSGPDLALSCEKGSLPDEKSKSYPLLEEIKHELASKGVFRHADMFALGEKLLKDFPALRGLLSRRFPLVYIDEMQDTSWAQEELLGRLFDESVVVQRFGDVNQQILSSDKGSENLTFPRDGFLNISSSKRFGPTIAKAVSALQLKGSPVVGQQSDAHPPTLILYSEKRVAEVIQYFGELVLGAFSDEQLKSSEVRALCSRKQGGSKAAPGRHLGDYWPPFEQHLHASTAKSDRLWELLGDNQSSVLDAGTLATRAGDSRRGVLLVLRAAGSHYVADIRDGPQLLRSFDQAGLPTILVRRLCRDLAVSRGLVSTPERRAQLPLTMYGPLRALLPGGMTQEQFAQLTVFDEPEIPPDAGESTRTCIVESTGRRVEVKIGTVASMKGETHLASLVLESHGGLSKRFDLEEAIQILAGVKAIDNKASDLLKGQFRNLYVAMSRPTDFLCLAANKSRVAQETVDKLTAQGWKIHVLG